MQSKKKKKTKAKNYGTLNSVKPLKDYLFEQNKTTSW